jgi:hypothetical protein
VEVAFFATQNPSGSADDMSAHLYSQLASLPRIALFAIVVDFIPASIIGMRLLQRPKLDIFRFLFAGAIAGFAPAFLILFIPIIGVVMIGIAIPGIIAGSLAGASTAWLYLTLAGQIPENAR